MKNAEHKWNGLCVLYALVVCVFRQRQAQSPPNIATQARRQVTYCERIEFDDWAGILSSINS